MPNKPIWLYLCLILCASSLLSNTGAAQRLYHLDYGPGEVLKINNKNQVTMRFDRGVERCVNRMNTRKPVGTGGKTLRAYHLDYGPGLILEAFQGFRIMKFDNGLAKAVDSSRVRGIVRSSHGVTQHTRAYHLDHGSGNVLEVFDGYLSMEFDNGKTRSVASLNTRRTVLSSHGIRRDTRAYHLDYGPGDVLDVFEGYLKMRLDNGSTRCVDSSRSRPTVLESHGARVGMRAYHPHQDISGRILEVFSGYASLVCDNGRNLVFVSQNLRLGRASSHGVHVGDDVTCFPFGAGQVEEVFQGFARVSFNGQRRVVQTSRCHQRRHPANRAIANSAQSRGKQPKPHTIDTIPLNLTAYTTLFGKAGTPLLLASAKLQKLVDGHRHGLLPGQKSTETHVLCPICLDDDFEEGSLSLECGHQVHLDCLIHMIKSKLGQEDLEQLAKCPADNCEHDIDYRVIGHLISDPETLVRLQRLIIRHIPDVKPCPHCNDNFL